MQLQQLLPPICCGFPPDVVGDAGGRHGSLGRSHGSHRCGGTACGGAAARQRQACLGGRGMPCVQRIHRGPRQQGGARFCLHLGKTAHSDSTPTARRFTSLQLITWAACWRRDRPCSAGAAPTLAAAVVCILSNSCSAEQSAIVRQTRSGGRKRRFTRPHPMRQQCVAAAAAEAHRPSALAEALQARLSQRA